jgi:hypothetical protein
MALGDVAQAGDDALGAEKLQRLNLPLASPG